jgi:hypothetical protein
MEFRENPTFKNTTKYHHTILEENNLFFKEYNNKVVN